MRKPIGVADVRGSGSWILDSEVRSVLAGSPLADSRTVYRGFDPVALTVEHTAT